MPRLNQSRSKVAPKAKFQPGRIVPEGGGGGGGRGLGGGEYSWEFEVKVCLIALLIT